MKILSTVFACALVAASVAAGVASDTVVTAQILDYERGYIFFTTGDGFKVSPGVVIVNGPPGPPRYARVTFDGSGIVTRIEVSRTKLPPEGNLAAIHQYAIALSSPQPNPELGQKPVNPFCAPRPGRLVALSVTVQVPPSTALTDNIYMTSDQSGWNPQAYKLDRIDALHYRTTLKLLSGTVMHVLFDRGSAESIQVGENGIQQKPYLLCIGDEDAQAFTRTVYRWADESVGGAPVPGPQSIPTPFNPAPFPNLPTPPPGPIHTPSAH